VVSICFFKIHLKIFVKTRFENNGLPSVPTFIDPSLPPKDSVNLSFFEFAGSAGTEEVRVCGDGEFRNSLLSSFI
jgi:hypothetical protein